jgi:hypothetical protein
MLSLLARRNSLSFMLLVAFPESVAADKEILGIGGMESFMAGLPLLPIATLSLTQRGSSRQSVGSHGDIT